MAEKINIASLDIDTEALITKATETKKSIDSLRDSQKNLKKIGEQNSKQFVKNEVELKKLSAEYNSQKNVLTKLTDENNRFIKSEQALTNAVNKEIKSIEVARKNNKELLAIRNKLNLSTDEGKKQLDLINKKLDDNNKFIKENVSAYEQQKIGIGDYEGALRKVFPAGGQLIDTLKQLKAGLVAQKTAMRGATVGTTGLSKASKLLRIALISTGIGAIVVAIGTLITAFTSTQKGADAVSKALAPIKGAFEGIIGVIQNISLNIFSQLGDRFTIVSGSILNGIDKIRLGWNKLSGDTEEAGMLQERIKERTEEIADATKSLEKKTSDFVKILSDAPNKIKESADAQVKVVALQKKIEEAEIRLIKQRAISMRIIKEQNKIAEDVTKTQAEREESAKRAIDESQKLLGFEQNIVDLKIRQTKLSQTQNDTDREGQKELKLLEAERENAKTRALEMQTTLQNKLNTIKTQTAGVEAKKEQDKLKKDEEELNRIEVFEQRKRDLKNKIALENAETEEERALLKAEQDLLKEQEALAKLELTAQEKLELETLLLTNAEQVKLDIMQNFLDKKNVAIDESNEKIVESEKKIGAERQKVAKTVESALIGLLGDSLGAKLGAIAIEAGIQASLVKINSASAIANVNSNTASAVSSAIAKTPLTVGLPFTPPIIASGVKNVAKIGATSSLAVSKILGASALKAVGTLASTKFEKGGVIGGKRHSSGGTKFIGSDGTRFEAEKGEYIGVMSRQATEKFMQFNDANTPSNAFTSSMRLNNTFESGGIVDSVGTSIKEPSQASDNIAKVIANEINKIKIVTVIDDVTNMQDIKTEIVEGANI